MMADSGSGGIRGGKMKKIDIALKLLKSPQAKKIAKSPQAMKIVKSPQAHRLAVKVMKNERVRKAVMRQVTKRIFAR
jgi:hypothetical protein